MNEQIRVLTEGGTAETELKKSRFIAYTEPVNTEEEARSFIESVKKKNFDAKHNCYAYTVGTDLEKVKYSDDGEPAQTAGLPIFTVLKESGIKNCCIVVTRYFGGTLLGTGPLSKMYRDTAKEGLLNSKTGVMKSGTEFRIDCDYGDGEKVRRFLEKSKGMLLNTVYAEKVSFLFRVPTECEKSFIESITSLTLGKVNPEKISEGLFLDTNS